MHQPRQHAVDVLHGSGAADQRDGLGLFVLNRRCRTIARLAHGAADNGDQFLQVERLGQIVISALLRRLDRRHESVLGAHDDNRHIRPKPLDARQQIEGVVVGHNHIGDNQVALAFRHPTPQGRGIGGQAHRIAGPRQRLVEHRADRRIIVGNEDGAFDHGRSPGSLSPAVPGWSKSGWKVPEWTGISRRNVVLFGCDLHSITPP